MSVVSVYAEFAEAAAMMKLPEEVLHHAKRATIDWFASTLPGGQQVPAKLLKKTLAEEIGLGSSTLFPSGAKTSPRNAALINGAAAHTIEFDDIFRDGLFHPGSPIVAAALAAAEYKETTGDQFLRGVIAGYEVSNRIARAVVPTHYEWWHTTATVGFFGTATAAAVILQLDGEKTAHALATVGSMSAGLQQAFRSDAMTKPIHAGRAAEGGLLAAMMAAEGITGALDILEGERGFGNAMSSNVDWKAAVDGLGSDFTITKMTQKNHAACGHIHAIIDSINSIRESHDFKVDDVIRVRANSYKKAKEICCNPNPKTIYEAKFSAEYCSALAVKKGGALRASDFSKTHLNDPELKKIMELVELGIDECCESAFPRTRSARVELELKDGLTLRHFAPTRKGDPDHPLSDAELSDKFRDLVVPIIGKKSAELFIQKLWSLEKIPLIHTLTEKQFH
ncbi:MAG: 2-methylcitrate dehydratase [Rhodospirillaceae bacterium]|nr:2-methylcitrate dehydratase [Rhodospirillaceae bacterium]|tara:strand:+ start:155 stop:1510 length:1356 start_codon:yes stop_codon:yes gene_type:complete